jgi:hypothetical protein
MGGEDEGGDHTEVEGEGEREDRLDRVQLQDRHTLVVRQGHLCPVVHIIVRIGHADPDPVSIMPLDPGVGKIPVTGS